MLRNGDIETMHDIRLLLKQFGTLIYTRDPGADLELMLDECRELHDMGLLDKVNFQKAMLLIKKELRKYNGES